MNPPRAQRQPSEEAPGTEGAGKEKGGNQDAGGGGGAASILGGGQRHRGALEVRA